MKKLLLSAALFVFLTNTASAQVGAVESVPLSQPTYTLKNETDPMAMDAPAPAGKSINKGEAIIAPPPPGEDVAREVEPMKVEEPQAIQGTQSAPAENPPSQYPAGPNTQPIPIINSNVTGVMQKDESKFERMKFCTLKVSFTSMGAGTDAKVGDQIKTYLDSNANKLTYTKTQSGKEGEYSYCLDIAEHNNRADVYKSLKQILLNSKPKAPVNMTGTGFAPYSTKKALRD